MVQQEAIDELTNK